MSQAGANYDGRKNPAHDLDNWVLFVLQCFSASVEVFLHFGFGRRYLGLRAAAVVLLIPLWCMICAPCDLRPMFCYLLAFLVMSGVHRVSCASRELRGAPPVHSLYSGRPWLLRVFPNWSEITVKKHVEPVVVCLAGYAMVWIYAPLGCYWMVTGFCMGISISQAERQQKLRAADMYDAVLDQQDVAERFREMRGEDF